MLVLIGFWAGHGGTAPPVPPPPDPVLLTLPEAVAGVLVGCVLLAAGMVGRAPGPVRWGVVAAAGNAPAWIVLVLYARGQSQLAGPLLVAAMLLVGLIAAALGRSGPRPARV